MTWAATGEPRGPLEIGITIGVVTLVVGIAAALILGSRPSRQPVGLVGDSITLLSGGELRAALGGSYAVKIDATSGHRIDEQMGAAASAVARKNEQIIINLGTNDVMQGDTDIDDAGARLEEMVAMFPDVRCIHLVTVSDAVRHDGVDPSEVPRRAKAINDTIRSLAHEDDRIRVVDWNQMVRDYQRDHPGTSPTEDTIHPNDAGKELLVDAYKAALTNCPS